MKWEDWPEERNTWEPALHLDNCDHVIARFRRRLKNMPEYTVARELQLKTLKVSFSPVLNNYSKFPLERPGYFTVYIKRVYVCSDSMVS